MLNPIGGNFYSGGSTWADLAMHLSLITNFSERGLDVLQSSPIYSGIKLNYPFLMDLISSIFFKSGFSLRLSLIIPSLIMLIGVIIVIYALSYKMTKSKIGSFFVPFLFFFNGSIFGVYYFWQDRVASSLPFFSFLNNMQKEYAHLADYNIRFSNIIADYILPQRAIILGLLIGVASIYFLWQYFDQRRNKDLLKAGFLISLLPLAHIHSFAAISMASIFLSIIDVFVTKDSRSKALKNWFQFFLIILILSLPQLLLISPSDRSGFIKIYIGWMRNPDEPLVWFWIKNLSPHLFIFFLSFLAAPRKIRNFFLPFFFVFILTNIIIFQPHNYDNMKIMLYTFLIGCILTVFLLDYIMKKFSKKSILLILPLLIALTLSGFLSVYRETYVSWQMFSKEDIELARFVKDNTAKNAIFLTSDQHNNPIPTLAGRGIVMGYRGWLWTYGINYSIRQADVYTMYEGGKESELFLNKYGVNYVLIERSKRGDFKMNENYFAQNFTAVYESQNYNLYKVD